MIFSEGGEKSMRMDASAEDKSASVSRKEKRILLG